MSSERLKLQIPADQYRCHYVKAKVRVHKYTDGSLAIFNGPRKLADYDNAGKLPPKGSETSEQELRLTPLTTGESFGLRPALASRSS